MRIGILTLYYENHNFGGQLQAYALCTFMNSVKSVICEQISYDYKEKKSTSVKSVLFSVYSAVFHPRAMLGLKKRKKKFEAFEETIPHSKVISNEIELKRLSDNYDYVFAGSDQVWNPEYAGGAFYLAAVPDKKRCSYAASFGKDRLPEGTLSDETVRVLRSYQFMSVREATAKQILEQNGIKDVEMVCDPTLLLTKEDWKKSIAQIKPITKEKYAFVYLLGNSKTMRDEIKKKVQSENLKIVAIPHIHFSYQKRDGDFADIEAYDVGPLDFLRLIYDADVIVTDSFHCTLFSILYGKKFWTLSRNSKNDSGSTNGRMYTLLEKAGLMNRFAGCVENIRLNEAVQNDNSEKKLFEYAEFSRKRLMDFLCKQEEQR